MGIWQQCTFVVVTHCLNGGDEFVSWLPHVSTHRATWRSTSAVPLMSPSGRNSNGSAAREMVVNESQMVLCPEGTER